MNKYLSIYLSTKHINHQMRCKSHTNLQNWHHLSDLHHLRSCSCAQNVNMLIWSSSAKDDSSYTSFLVRRLHRNVTNGALQMMHYIQTFILKAKLNVLDSSTDHSQCIAFQFITESRNKSMKMNQVECTTTA